MKKLFVKDLKIGMPILNELFCIKEFSAEKGTFILTDRSGSVDALLVEPTDALLELIQTNIGSVFEVSGAVLNNPSQTTALSCLVKVRELSLASEFRPEDIFDGISPERVEFYIQQINAAKENIHHKGYRQLVDYCLSEETLRKLGNYPATHAFYGVYVGGALAATCSVTWMCMNCLASYVKRGNGISTQPPDWSLLVSAGLLHQIGRLKYFDENDPFKKSTRGVILNYFSTLQSTIEDAIRCNNFELSEEDIAKLLNTLNVATSGRTDTKAITKDGTVLRYILHLYSECDAYDWLSANHVKAEGETFYYDTTLRRYVLTSVTEEEV